LEPQRKAKAGASAVASRRRTVRTRQATAGRPLPNGFVWNACARKMPHNENRILLPVCTLCRPPFARIVPSGHK